MPSERKYSLKFEIQYFPHLQFWRYSMTFCKCASRIICVSKDKEMRKLYLNKSMAHLPMPPPSSSCLHRIYTDAYIYTYIWAPAHAYKQRLIDTPLYLYRSLCAVIVIAIGSHIMPLHHGTRLARKSEEPPEARERKEGRDRVGVICRDIDRDLEKERSPFFGERIVHLFLG